MYGQKYVTVCTVRNGLLWRNVFKFKERNGGNWSLRVCGPKEGATAGRLGHPITITFTRYQNCHCFELQLCLTCWEVVPRSKDLYPQLLSVLLSDLRGCMLMLQFRSTRNLIRLFFLWNCQCRQGINELPSVGVIIATSGAESLPLLLSLLQRSISKPTLARNAKALISASNHSVTDGCSQPCLLVTRRPLRPESHHAQHLAALPLSLLPHLHHHILSLQEESLST